MLSRVAESIYWMARYVERAENTARFVDVTQNLSLDQPAGVMVQWEPLIYITGDQDQYKERYDDVSPQSVIQFMAFDREYNNSIVRGLEAARENARSVRETISTEMWEHLNELYHWIRDASHGTEAWESPSVFFQQVKMRCQAFGGICDDTMTRDQGWHFANMGRMLERADMISRLIDVKYFTLLRSPEDVNTPIDDLQWSSVLRSVSGFEMFRQLHNAVTVENVVDFLAIGRRFPRAIHYCLIAADQSLHAISGQPEGAYSNLAERHLGQLRSELAFADSTQVVQRGLHEFVDDLQNKLNRIGDSVHDRFFAMRPAEPMPTDGAYVY